MADQDQSAQNNLSNAETNEDTRAKATPKRKFLEPEISQPVDVLEATTFFQQSESGPTN